ncbi:MAG: hypothetical protein JNJ86_14155 [Chitinophagaceae bacterium]|nr:hypothetical protein [Chitinophagaceae bacterium]
MRLVGIITILPVVLSCNSKKDTAAKFADEPLVAHYKSISDIKTPAGYKRLKTGPGSFGEWLRKITLKKSKTVYCWDGSLKKNQSVQFAVLDMPVGKKDLQQCADAVMRLRSEYLFAQQRFSEIVFTDNAEKVYQWRDGSNRSLFEQYLENVFGWCGSASLERQLVPVNKQQLIEPGDVFIKGGFPGHAMIVVDVAINSYGERIFMLAQSYMPAQDIHIVNNPTEKEMNPWFSLHDTIITPEWIFSRSQLRKW